MATTRETTFDEAAARKWIESVKEVNSDTENLLQSVTDCIDDIQAESEGPMVEALTQIAAGLSTGFATLVKSLCALVTALEEIISKFRAMVDNVVTNMKSAASKMLGGISVDVTV